MSSTFTPNDSVYPFFPFPRRLNRKDSSRIPKRALFCGEARKNTLFVPFFLRLGLISPPFRLSGCAFFQCPPPPSPLLCRNIILLPLFFSASTCGFFLRSELIGSPFLLILPTRGFLRCPLAASTTFPTHFSPSSPQTIRPLL